MDMDMDMDVKFHMHGNPENPPLRMIIVTDNNHAYPPFCVLNMKLISMRETLSCGSFA